MSLSLRHELRHDLRLSQSQKLDLRLSLLQTLRGIEADVANTCPNCQHRIDNKDLLKGFRRDPYDTTSLCPKCKNRFQPKLIYRHLTGHMEINFYCPAQTLHALAPLENATCEYIKREKSAVYYSALTHFGSLTEAFKQIGVRYHLDEKIDWKDKVTPFLGQFPDCLIAECVGVSRQAVTSLRNRLGIDRYEKED